MLRYVEDHLGHTYHHVQEELTARPPTHAEADALGISPALPGVRVLYTAYDPSGTVIEIVDSVFRSDRHAFVDAFDISD